MTVSSTHKQSRLAWLRTWKGPAALACVLLLLFVWWLIPSKIDRVETIDGQHSWQADRAPARRLFVWAPPAALEVEGAEVEHIEGGSLIRPQLTDGGGTLYFTLRRPDGTADVFRSRLVDGAWSQPRPAEEFNSPADDLGLVLSGDGRQAYWYSNRPGGFGGFDVYSARREADGWSAAENLGAQVNTAAHEYDPALSPDGLTLLFASNRTARMQDATLAPDQVQDGENAQPQASGVPRDWSASLRAHPGHSTFDLYRAERFAAGAIWNKATPLAELNRPDSNEGSPALAPGGVHVYFSSDRPGGSGGFDLYRAKLSSAAGDQVENLGPSVNTAADELEPGLSPEGFALLFSSNRGQPQNNANVEVFALYRSQAVEVTEESGWDDSNWLAFAGMWWWAALLLLGAALVVFAWIYSHRWLAEAAVAFRFFLASLMFHVLLVLLLAFMIVREQVLEIRDELAAREEVPEFIDVLPEPAPEPGLSPFDQTVEPAAPEPASAAVQRQAQSEPLAEPAETPRPTISQELARQLPPELVTRVAPPRVEPDNVEPRELTRRAMDLPRQSELPEEAIELDADEASPERALNAPAADLARAEQQSPQSRAADAPRTKIAARIERPLPAAQTAAPPRNDAATMPDLARRDAAQPEQSAAQLAENDAVLSAARIAAEQPLEDAPAQARSPTAPAAGASPAVLAARSMSDIPSRAASAIVASRSPADRELAPSATSETRVPRSPSQAILESSAPLPEADAPMIAGQSASDLPQLAMSDPGPLRGAEQAVAAASAIISPNEAASLGERPTRPLLVGPSAAAAALRTEQNTELARATSAAALAEAAPLDEAAAAALAGETRPGDVPLASGLEAARSDDPAAAVAMAAPSAAVLEGAAAGPAPLIARRTLDAAELLPAGDGPARASDDFAAAEIEDRVSVRQMFALRGDERKAFIEEFGGTADSERAIDLGLAWLAKIQKPEGHWQLQDHQGGVQSDTAAVGFALLPFLGQGKTHKKGDYQATVEKGLKWLVEHQKPDGDLFSGGAGNAHMYSHGVAAIALCEAYGVTGDEALRGPAQKAIDFIVAAQHQQTGGWRYHPGEPGDTSVVGWQVMALKSGEMAGLSVPQTALDLATRWLDSAEGKDAARGQFGYQGPGGSPAMTAEGLLCRQFLGAGRRDPSMKAGADFLLARLPQPGQESSYYWYYATQVMYHMQGEHWRKWNAALRDVLVKSQEQGGDNAGSWPTSDPWEQQGGRIYATSLRLLMLEVYYRHLPLYRQLGP